MKTKTKSIARILCVTGVAALLSSGAAQAANVLANPGFETSPALTGWSVHTTEGWSINGANTQGKLYRTGANGLWTQGLYLNGGAPPYYNMYAYQRLAAAAGSTYTADAWFSQYSFYYQHQGGDNGAGSGLFTVDSFGVEECWVEVQFLDATGTNILADYRSSILSPVDATLPGSAGVKTINVTTWPTLTNVIPGVATNTYLEWIHCVVTNVCDLGTIGPNSDPSTNIVNSSLSDGIMTAPPGTAYVQFMLNLAQAQYESGANYWDDCTLNQLAGPSPSVISGLTPDGSKFFNTNTSLSFTVNSASTGGAPLPTNPTSGVKVVVNGTDQSSNLQFGGTPTALTVNLPGLTSNTLYNVSITVSNSAGLITTANPAFDTLNAVFVVPVETYDYNGGQFIQNPIPTNGVSADSYFGRAGLLGTDMSTYGGTGVLPAGPSTLIPFYPNRTDSNVAFEVSSDIQLPLYTAQNNPGIYNVDFSYNNAGNWYNYTRNPWPTGKYQVFARVSGGQGAGSELLNILTSGYGTPTQTTNNLGQFYLANGTDWTKYYWIPLTDANGNLVGVEMPPGLQTLQLCSSPIAGENVISFVFVTFPTAGLPPAIGNVNPPNGTVFATASTFSFTVTSDSAINPGGIHLTLNGADVSSMLTIGGTSTSRTVSYPIGSNVLYTAVIAVTNSLGSGVTRTTKFDTVRTDNFVVQAEDYDYNGGQFNWADNGLTPNGYLGNNEGITNVDFSHFGGGGTFVYRTGMATETASDILLPLYTADYDVGWFNNGEWANYTRNYSAGNYFVYGRLAGGSGVATAYLDKVTAGVGTTNQTLHRLGTMAATPGGWQSWVWVPLTDAGLVAPVTVTLGGTNTLRLTSGNNVNANYFMLIPASGIKVSAAKSGANMVISFPTQPGATYRVFSRSSLSTGSWSLLTAVAGDGSVKSVSDPATAGTRFYEVTSP